MNFDLNRELVFENENAWFYKDDNCVSLTKYIRKDDECNGNKGLKGWYVLLVKNKHDESQEYLIFNDRGEIYDVCNSFEGTAVKIDIIKFARMK